MTVEYQPFVFFQDVHFDGQDFNYNAIYDEDLEEELRRRFQGEGVTEEEVNEFIDACFLFLCCRKLEENLIGDFA